jgi:serine/threonine-protein kinase
MIAQAMGDSTTLTKALDGFLASSDQPCENIDITLGRSSTRILFELLSASSVDLEQLKAFGQQTFDDPWGRIDHYDEVGKASELAFLGMAHGWAGILYATMRWCEATGALRPSALRSRLTELAQLGKNKGASLPRTMRGKEFWPGWCHGTSGYVHLWTLARSHFGDDAYLELALRSGLHVDNDKTLRSGHLCCGLAGQGYALLNLYKCTRDQVWRNRAQELAERAIISAKKHGGHRAHSLYKGDVGIALLQMDLTEPDRAAMPLFEIGW